MRGIYKIVNKKSRMTYIGSAKDIKVRFAKHRKDLVAQTHHNYKMQQDYYSYGLKSFSLKIIEKIPDKAVSIIDREQVAIDAHMSLKEGFRTLYNIYPIADRNKMSETFTEPAIIVIMQSENRLTEESWHKMATASCRAIGGAAFAGLMDIKHLGLPVNSNNEMLLSALKRYIVILENHIEEGKSKTTEKINHPQPK